MPITAAEQYGIELLNRARLDPLGEAARYGIDLNAGLAAGTITPGVKQPVAPHAILDLAAERHSTWIIDTDTFSHTGINGSDPGQRMAAAGYVFSGGWSWAENLALRGLGRGVTADSVIDLHQEAWMNSPLHRAAMLGNSYREIGFAQVVGNYQGSTVSVATANYAHRDGVVYVTGVAYNDRDGDHFYSIGEGTGGIRFAIAGGAATATAAAGGYGVLAPQNAAVTVDIGSIGQVIVNLAAGNVKLDLVNGTTLWSSGHTTLVAGINEVGLLGVGNLDLTGNAAANVLRGNAGANVIMAWGGNDIVTAGGGNDRVVGDAGNDTLYGGDGADVLNGGAGDDFIFGGDTAADLRDVIYGGDGNDRVDAGYGNDQIFGGNGNDSVEGGFGVDEINGQAGNDVLTGSAFSDLIFGGDGNDFINGGFGFDRVNGGAGTDRFYHVGVIGHGSDWVQDYHAAEGDVLVAGINGATRSQFQVNLSETAGAGAVGVQEAFVIYRPSGQVLWALIDGAAQAHINLQIGAQVFDLLA